MNTLVPAGAHIGGRIQRAEFKAIGATGSSIGRRIGPVMAIIGVNGVGNIGRRADAVDRARVGNIQEAGRRIVLEPIRLVGRQGIDLVAGARPFHVQTRGIIDPLGTVTIRIGSGKALSTALLGCDQSRSIDSVIVGLLGKVSDEACRGLLDTGRCLIDEHLGCGRSRREIIVDEFGVA